MVNRSPNVHCTHSRFSGPCILWFLFTTYSLPVWRRDSYAIIVAFQATRKACVSSCWLALHRQTNQEQGSCRRMSPLSILQMSKGPHQDTLVKVTINPGQASYFLSLGRKEVQPPCTDRSQGSITQVPPPGALFLRDRSLFKPMRPA